MTEDEKNEIIARVLQAVGAVNIPASPYPLPAPARVRGGSIFNTIGSIILIGLCIFGGWALLVVYLSELTGSPQTVYSTPPALILPTASIGGSQGRTTSYSGNDTRIVEATFPPPIPEQAPAAIPPTPWPADEGATAQAATDVAGNMTATAESQGVIDRWLNGPPSSATPTVWADFVQSFSTPEPCSRFVGYIAGPCKPTPTPEE